MSKFFIRNLIEYLAIGGIWWCLQNAIAAKSIGEIWLTSMVLVVMWAKTVFFGAENIQQLMAASRDNTAYHRFMLIMLVNMSQIILSFALDYHLLHKLNPESFGAVSQALTTPELMFEYLYYSVLNFTFFGYGDVTPQSIPAKLMTMTEILLAFITVIFLLSDFVSLKESILSRKR